MSTENRKGILPVSYKNVKIVAAGVPHNADESLRNNKVVNHIDNGDGITALGDSLKLNLNPGRKVRDTWADQSDIMRSRVYKAAFPEGLTTDISIKPKAAGSQGPVGS